MRHFLLVFFLLSPALGLLAQTPAFPGAEGHGRYASGGRGGKVYYVNTLLDNSTGNSASGEGSLRWCLSQSGARIILFKVSGTIVLNSNLGIKNGNVTIAGQSAPGDGICISGFPVSVDADNVVIRYLRFRMGDEKLTVDAASGADALGGRSRKNVIIDHCSVSWSTDECASFYQNQNFTMQWCIVSESLRWSKHEKGTHGYGGIWGGTNASFHHNLLAHHDSRNPRLGPGEYTDPHSEVVDMRNNVIYNWCGNACYGGEGMAVNIVNCYYKPGPATPAGSKRGRIISIDKSTDATNPKAAKRLNVWGKFYISGNVIGDTDDDSKRATQDNWAYGVNNQFASGYGTVPESDKAAIKVDVPFNAGVVTTHSAGLAYEKVLAHAGASLHRDDYDKRIIEETLNRTAAFKGLSVKNSGAYPKPGIIDSQSDLKPTNAAADWSPWPTLRQETAPIDLNLDGIPDTWLETHFPGKLATDKNEEGYTYLEVYLNELVAAVSSAQNEGGVTTGLRQTLKTTTRNPVRYNQRLQQLVFDIGNEVQGAEIYTSTGVLVQKLKLETSRFVLPFSKRSNGLCVVRLLDVNGFVVNVSKF